MNRQVSVDLPGVGGTSALIAAETSFSNMLVDSDRRRSVDETTIRFNKASPFGQLLDALRREAGVLGLWNDDMQRDLPKRWEKHGDLIILPHNSFKHPNWRLMGPKLWQTVTESLKAGRLGKKRVIEGDDFNRPHIDLLYGKDGWVEHIDNDIRFFYDVTKCMFNIDNISEKQRISEFDCHQEVVVDMFAGIGYYTLPYLVKAHAKHVYAIDWDEDAIKALQNGLESNNVHDRCTIVHGNSRKVAPQGVADRVNLGLIPSSRPYWLAACKCLKTSGGILHIHEAVRMSEQDAEHLEFNDKPIAHPKQSKITRKESMKSVSEESGLGDMADNNNIDIENSAPLETDEKIEGVFLNESMDDNLLQHEEMNTMKDDNTPVKRKLSRSATIIEEVENRFLPNGRIDNHFKEEKWPTISQTLRDFAMLCAVNCTRYLNNIHDQKDKVWACTILGINKVRSYPMHTDHIVVDLLCHPEDEKAAKAFDLHADFD